MSYPALPIDYHTPANLPPRGGLVGMGIVLIVLGSLAGCVAMTMPLAIVGNRMAAARGQPTQAMGSIVLALLLYAAIATAFIWGGIASIRARRWVRPLMLSVSWPWLVGGLLGSAMWLAMMPDFQIPVPPGGTPLPPGVVQGMVIGMTVMMLIFYLVLPGMLVAFYQRQSVQARLDAWDPVPRWTDRAPLPVLGLSVVAVLGGLMMLAALPTGVVPLFGHYLSGPAGIGLIVLVAATLVLAGILSYRLNLAGWVLAVLVVGLGTASAVTTFWLSGMEDMFAAANLPAEQLDAVRHYRVLHGPWPGVMAAVSGALALGYLAWVLRYFRQAKT